MNFLLKICVLLKFVTPVVLTNNGFLFDSGIMIYKRPGDPQKRHFFLQHGVKFIDQHIIPDAVLIKIQSTTPRLHEGSFKNLAKLERLGLPKCKIHTISPKAFQNLPKLMVLHLQDNYVERIESGVFNNLPIKELYLQRNKITFIRSNAFDDMPNLWKIQLNSNKLQFWDRNWFRNTPSLTLLYFRRNLINEIPPAAFTNIRMSHKIDKRELVDTVIYLSRNHISTIHSKAFEGVDAVSELWLDRNHLTKIDKNAFSNIKELEKLSLRRNKITEVDKSAFKSIQLMTQLDLSNNALNCLPNEVISKAHLTNVANNPMSCDCLKNLIDHLQESRAPHRLVYNSEC